MAIRISGTTENSIARRLGIHEGSCLVSVNGNEINDLLDYGFYTTDSKLEIVIRQGNALQSHTVVKGEYEELGFQSDSFLMDEQHHCRNHCIFCFIDQLPEGLREALYFKDDDERLSFLFGNYITLTNLDDAHIQRMIRMKISPVNVSVHTTNEELRCRMMGNPGAGHALRHLYALAQHQVPLNCQIVLCPGVNDGEHLIKTLDRLISLESCVSIACVPVGLTRYREHLTPLAPYDRESARTVLDIIDGRNRECRHRTGRGLVYASDEFYLVAERALPDEGYYDGYPQLENGVGMITQFETEFSQALESATARPAGVHCTIVTGRSSHRVLAQAVEKAALLNDRLEAQVVAADNHLFGPTITVTGLLGARDVARTLSENPGTGDVLISRCMLNTDGLFLDDLTVQDLELLTHRAVHVIDTASSLAGWLMPGQG